MRKRWIATLAMLVALTLAWAANVDTVAEGGLTRALASVTPTQEIAISLTLAPAPTVTPTPEPTPAPVIFEGDMLKLTLPQGFELVEGDALAGFEAALQADYPGAARTLFAAVDAEREAAVIAAELASSDDCLDAAREAADALIGDPEAATESQFGENRCASFACAIGERGYYLYYFSDGERLIVIGVSGLESAEVEAMLAGAEMKSEAAIVTE